MTAFGKCHEPQNRSFIFFLLGKFDFINTNVDYGICGPGGRVEDSRSEGPVFKSRNWAKFQSYCEVFEIGFHMRRRSHSVNGERRENYDLMETCFLVNAIIQKAQLCEWGHFQ